jgi:hypothetical protein
MKKVFDQTVRDLYVISVLYPPSYTLCAIASIICLLPAWIDLVICLGLHFFFAEKREVNKKVLKVSGIEQKVEDSAPATLSHTTISWANSFICSYFPLPAVRKRMMFTVLVLVP